MTKEQAKPFGRSLEDLWLEEGGVPDPKGRYPKNKSLHKAEWFLMEKSKLGKMCELDEEQPYSPTENNLIRGEFIRFLALGGDDKNRIHEKGIHLARAYVKGRFDCGGCKVPHSLNIQDCTIRGLVGFSDCQTKTLDFTGCQVSAFDGNRLRCHGDLKLANVVARESVLLAGSKIHGDLNCSAATFEDDDYPSLDCTNLEVTGDVILSSITAIGLVTFFGSIVGSDFNCFDAKFDDEHDGLECGLIRVGGSFRCNGNFRAAATVGLYNASIDGDITCQGGQFNGLPMSILAEQAHVKGSVYLDDRFAAAGVVNFADARVGTNLSCKGGVFSCKDVALTLKNAVISGDLNFGPNEHKRRSTFSGSISLKRTTIGGDVIFNATSFDAIGQVNMNNAKVAGQLIWRDLVSKTPVEDTTAMAAAEPTWFNRVWPPILPKRSDMAANAEVPKPPVGELNLAGASCQTISMDEASWHMPGTVRIDHFTYEGFSQLNEDWNATRWINWLERQPDKHLTKRFRPHPYQQLAKVLDAAGFEDEARSIRIERKERQRIFARDHEPKPETLWLLLMRQLGLFWRFLQKWIIGHGYRPGVAVFWLVAIIALGTGIYQKAAWDGVITPAHPLIFKEAIWHGELKDMPPGKIPAACRENWIYPQRVLAKHIAEKCAASIPSEYSTFSALVYSLDVAVPVVNFRMENDWSPRVVNWQTGQHDWYGWWVRTWEWFQIGLGWAFSLLFVSAISGVIRRD